MTIRPNLTKFTNEVNEEKCKIKLLTEVQFTVMSACLPLILTALMIKQ